MKNLILLVLFTGITAVPAMKAKEPLPKSLTVMQLGQMVDEVRDHGDAEVVAILSGLKLTERLDAEEFARLEHELPGETSQLELRILADQSAFLESPSTNVAMQPIPDPAALRSMLVQIVKYVNGTTHQLPNLIATREVSTFQDRPAETVQEATATVSYSQLPLHFAGRSVFSVTYRDGNEEDKKQRGDSLQTNSQSIPLGSGRTVTPLPISPLSEKQELASTVTQTMTPEDNWADSSPIAGKHDAPAQGMTTSGEFGPVLRTAVGDAIRGKITWGHWLIGHSRKLAVFNFSVPEGDSHYLVQFCCITDFDSSSSYRHVFSEKVGYHGEIDFDPSTGVISRLAFDAELKPGELVTQASTVIEYGVVVLDGRSATCPLRSVSIMQVHTSRPREGMHMAVYSGIPQTFLNEVVFGNYHRFGSKAKIVNWSPIEDQPSSNSDSKSKRAPSGDTPKQ